MHFGILFLRGIVKTAAGDISSQTELFFVMHDTARFGVPQYRYFVLATNSDIQQMATLEWVDWYNNRRLFEALGDIPPAEAESAYYATMTPSESPRMAEQTLH